MARLAEEEVDKPWELIPNSRRLSGEFQPHRRRARLDVIRALRHRCEGASGDDADPGSGGEIPRGQAGPMVRALLGVNSTTDARRDLRRGARDARTARCRAAWTTPATVRTSVGRSTTPQEMSSNQVSGFVPFLSAPNPTLGIVAAVLLFAVVLGIAMSVSHLLNVGERRYRLLVALGVVGVAVGAILAAERKNAIDALRAATAFVLHLATAPAVGRTPSAALLPIVGLLAVGAPVLTSRTMHLDPH
jgi:hypothetical protein